MNPRLIAAAIVSGVIFFGLGFYVGGGAGATPPTTLSPSPDLARTAERLTTLQTSNAHLQAETDRLNADLVRLRDANAQLTAQIAATPAPTRTPTEKPPSVTLGMSAPEQQRAMLMNLRQIDAARVQFKKTKGQAAGSVHDLVGVSSYIKTVRTVGGEDYSTLSMEPGQPLTVTAPDGTSMTYDPTGVNTTKIELPPEVVRIEELTRRSDPAVKKAVEAYRVANSGKDPANPQALIPFFATTQEGADFVELLEAQKAQREGKK